MKTFLAGLLTGIVITVAGSWAYFEYLHITPIGDIKGQKDTFNDKHVRVRGTADKVTDPGPLCGLIHMDTCSAFKLADDSGKIWVLSDEAGPAAGEKVKVAGVVKVMGPFVIIWPDGKEMPPELDEG